MIKFRSKDDAWPFHPPVWINLRYIWDILKRQPEKHIAIGKQQEPNITHLIGNPYCSHCKGHFKILLYINHHLKKLSAPSLFRYGLRHLLRKHIVFWSLPSSSLQGVVTRSNLYQFHHHESHLQTKLGGLVLHLAQTFPGIHWNPPPWWPIHQGKWVDGVLGFSRLHDVIIFENQLAWEI